MDLNNKRIIISRTDSIGDVMLTLPMCFWIKQTFPKTEIIFLGRGYTQPVIDAYSKVDQFENWDDYKNLHISEQVEKIKKLNADGIIHVFPNKQVARVVKKAKIPIRVGTSHRTFHLTTCNHRVNFTRKRANIHESQLNHELLRPFGLTELPTLEQITATMESFIPVKVKLPAAFDALKNTTILHPKSQGSAKEWSINNYLKLAQILAEKGEQVVFTGTKEEGDLFRTKIPNNQLIFDTTGKLSLAQLMLLIRDSKNFVACSTGPLHIAGCLGINTIGLFSPKKPIHPQRWRPIGNRVCTLLFDEKCEACSKGKSCDCIEKISVQSVLDKLV